mgnify:CR=1 FL=1
MSKVIKTIETELLAITQVAANAQQLSSELDLSANLKNIVALCVMIGRTATTAFVGAGTEIRVEASFKATGNDAWVTIASYTCAIAAATEITADGAEAAGQTLIEIGANTPVVNDIVFWENATIGSSEWGKVVAISAGVSFTLQDGLTIAQAAAKLIYNKGEKWAPLLDCTGYTRIRVVINNNNGTTNVAVDVRVSAITAQEL